MSPRCSKIVASGPRPPSFHLHFHLFGGFLHRLQCLLQLAALEKDPPQAIEIRKAFGILLQGLADHHSGFIKVFALLGIEIAQIVVGPRIVRIALEQKLELGFALGEVPFIHIDNREILANVRHDLVVVGMAFEHALEEFDRLVVTTELG